MKTLKSTTELPLKSQGYKTCKSIDFEPIFYIGHEPFYNLSVTNEGNNTAYNVPIYIYVKTKLSDGLPRIRLTNVGKSVLNGLDLSSYSDEDKDRLKELEDQIGNNLDFIRIRDIDELSGDSVLISSGYFFIDIPPMSARKITVSVATKDSIECYFTIPNEWLSFSGHDNYNFLSKKRLLKRNAAKDNFCCYHDRVECVLNVVSTVAEVASLCGAVGSADIVNCVSSTLSQISQTVSDIVCSEEADKAEKTSMINYLTYLMEYL